MWGLHSEYFGICLFCIRKIAPNLHRIIDGKATLINYLIFYQAGDRGFEILSGPPEVKFNPDRGVDMVGATHEKVAHRQKETWKRVKSFQASTFNLPNDARRCPNVHLLAQARCTYADYFGLIILCWLYISSTGFQIDHRLVFASRPAKSWILKRIRDRSVKSGAQKHTNSRNFQEPAKHEQAINNSLVAFSCEQLLVRDSPVSSY